MMYVQAFYKAYFLNVVYLRSTLNYFHNMM
jgi:hypothetical protein